MEQHKIIENYKTYIGFVNTCEWLKSDATLYIFIIYAIIIFGGVFGNLTLIFSICSQPSSIKRKPFLFLLCIADLLVLIVSAPLSITLLSLASNSWTLGSISCKTMNYLKVNIEDC